MNTSKRKSMRFKQMKETTTTNKSHEKIANVDISSIPIIKHSQTHKLLPKYTSVLGRNGEDGVSMDELDHLQHDLERLLSTNALRVRYLLSAVGEIDRNVDRRDRRACHKATFKTRPAGKRRFKQLISERPIRKNIGSEANKIIVDKHLKEVPKLTVPRNDNLEKFWAFIQPYCSKATKNDVAYLDTLIQEFSKEISSKIPEIGPHYTDQWSDEILDEDENHAGRPFNKLTELIDIRKTGLNGIADRILSGLRKGKFKNKSLARLKSSGAFRSSSNIQKLGTCLDKRLKKKLAEHGVLALEELAKNPDDEILKEIKKCREELTTMNEYNIDETTKLKTIVVNDMRNNEKKKQLEDVDKQVLDLFNKVLVAKKSTLQQDGESFDKEMFNEHISEEFEVQTDSLVRQQTSLCNGMTNEEVLD